MVLKLVLDMDAYEQALLDIGGSGKFQQRYLILYDFGVVVCTAIVYLNIVMVLTVPPHSCRLPAKPTNISETEWKRMNIPLEQDAKGAMVISSCRMYINKNNETSECEDGYEYDLTWYHSTAASDNDWVCDQELLVANAFAYSRVGEVVGSVGLGWLGDKYGRKTAYIISLALMISGRAITTFSSGSFVIFLCGALIAALPSMAASQSTMVISMETTTSENRAKIVMVQNLGWATGISVLALFYWWLRDWFSYVMVTTLTLVPFFMMSWHLFESPRWLWTMGRPKECVKLLRRIAHINGKRLRPEVERALLDNPPAPDSTALGPLTLFSNPTLALNTLCVLITWFCCCGCYAILMMSAGESDGEGNPFLRFASQGFAEVPGYLLGAWLADRFGRRFTACSTLGVAAVLSITSFITIWDYQHNWILSMAMLMSKKICITANYYVIALIATEIFPTCLRQTGMSLGTVVAAAAFAMAPYILLLGRTVDTRLPGFIVVLYCVIGGLAASVFPETLHAILPETLQDARTFGANRRKYYFKLPQKSENKTEKAEAQIFSDFSQQKN